MSRLSKWSVSASGEQVESVCVLSQIRRPAWMGVRPDGAPSNLTDDVWYLGDHLPGSDKSYLTISWSFNSCSGVGSGRASYWLNLSKQLAYAVMESDKTDLSRTSSLAGMAREIRALCEWLSEVRKCHSVTDVKAGDIEAFELYVASLNIKANSVLLKLIAVRYLWLMQHEIGAGLAFDPYIRPGSLAQKARMLGGENGHTPTLVPEDLFRILDTAIRLTAEGADLVVMLERYLKLRAMYGRNVSHYYAREFGHSSRELLDKVRLAYGAAIVVLLALFGDRKHEIASKLATDVLALLNGDAEGLVGSVRKTSPTITGNKTVRPVIREVRQALELIMELTRETREHYVGDSLLLALPIMQSVSNGQPRLELATSRMYPLIQLVADEAGVAIKLRPHMFRRAFAMLWTWRFEIGDKHWLSRLLYHNDLTFTRYYTEDEDTWSFLPEAEREYAREVMEDALTGRRPVVGGVSKALRRYSRLIQSRLSVMTPESVRHFVASLLERHEYRVIPQVDGYCMMSMRRGARAKCSTDGQWPNYSNRDESYCVGCANFGVMRRNRDQWVARKEAHQRVFDSTDIPILRDASELAIQRAEKVIGWIDNDGVGNHDD